MNSITVAIGPDAADRVALAAQSLEEHFACETHIHLLGSSAVGVSRMGSNLLGQAKDGEVKLWLLATLFNDQTDWPDKDCAPLDDPDLAAAWLIERYRCSGTAFLDGVIGQFSLVLHDRDCDLLLIAADPTGGRSFFSATLGDTQCFSTKLDLIAAMASNTLAINRKDEDFFLVHGFHPRGRTLFEGVTLLAAGEMIAFRQRSCGRLRINPGTVTKSDPGSPKNEDLACELEHLFLEVLAAQLPSNKQKVGVLLGGFDSALVAAAIMRLGHEVATYSFRYPDAGYNQPHTDTLARHIGCEHHWIDIDKEMIARGLEQFPHLFNQPTNWPNYVIQTLRVVERMRADGIGYCYSGDGCDAVFLGYPGTFARAKLIERLPLLPSRLHKWLLKVAARPALDRLLGHPYRVALGLLRATGRPAFARDFLSFRVLDEIGVKQLKRNANPPDLEPQVVELSRPHSGLPGVRRAFLGKAQVSPNRSKMIASADATGIPVLAPYMHPRLKAWALSLPIEQLRPDQGGPATGKAILAEMAIRSGLLPTEIVWQPKMAAVDAPIDEWYAGPLRGSMMVWFEDLPFAADRRYLSRLLDIKRSESVFKEKVMTDKVISHASSLIATYARFASLAKRPWNEPRATAVG